MLPNTDRKTVEGFGEEWAYFDQAALDERERLRNFENYFEIFPWEELPANAQGFDLGCGSGRWAQLVAPRVGHLHCIDASEAALVQLPGITSQQSIIAAFSVHLSKRSPLRTIRWISGIRWVCCITFPTRKVVSSPALISSNRAHHF